MNPLTRKEISFQIGSAAMGYNPIWDPNIVLREHIRALEHLDAILSVIESDLPRWQADAIRNRVAAKLEADHANPNHD